MKKYEGYHDFWMSMRRIGFLFLLSLTPNVRDYSQWTSPPFILWVIWRIYCGNKLNKVPFSVTSFFGSNSIPGNITSLCLSKYGFLPSPIGFLHTVRGCAVPWREVCMFFLLRNISSCYDVVEMGVGIVTVYVCISFLSWRTVWSELETLVDRLAQKICVCRILQKFDKYMGNKVWWVRKKSKELVVFCYWFEYSYANECSVWKNWRNVWDFIVGLSIFIIMNGTYVQEQMIAWAFSNDFRIHMFMDVD